MVTDVLRWAVSGLAMLTVGGTLAVAVPYLVATWRNHGKAPGRILARHVVEVSFGSAGLAAGYGIATYAQLGGVELLPANGRLILYIAAMVLLLIGVIEVGRYQRIRRRTAASQGPGRHHR